MEDFFIFHSFNKIWTEFPMKTVQISGIIRLQRLQIGLKWNFAEFVGKKLNSKLTRMRKMMVEWKTKMKKESQKTEIWKRMRKYWQILGSVCLLKAPTPTEYKFSKSLNRSPSNIRSPCEKYYTIFILLKSNFDELPYAIVPSEDFKTKTKMISLHFM